MKALGLQTLRVADIDFGDRLRQVDTAHADLLAQNIREVGRLRQPIEVRTRKGRGKGVRPYVLIAGGHRLQAATILGWEEVDAFVLEMTDDEARLAEIDENLVRHELNPLDRAVFLAERKALYEKLNPETKAGVAGAEAKHGRANDIMSFAADTAERCGLTERTIQRAVAIATGLRPDIRQRIAGTFLARKQSGLLALVKLSPAEQAAALDLLLAEEPKAKTVEQAARLIRGVRASTDADAALSKLLRAWRDAPAATKRAFLAAKMEDEADTILRDFVLGHGNQREAA